MTQAITKCCMNSTTRAKAASITLEPSVETSIGLRRHEV